MKINTKTKAKAASNVTFQSSTELRRMYNDAFAIWSRKHRLGMAELAERTGVSTQYLGQVGRYGRIPGKPILLLLALNLELADPDGFLRAAQMSDRWPFEPTVGLRAQSAAESGFISMHVDMPGFASVIREIVRAEVRPQTAEQLLLGKPLRIGLNRGQSFLFGEPKVFEGYFPELMRQLALSLRSSVIFSDVSHAEFAEKLSAREIDLYGPVYMTPNRIGQALFTNSFCSVQLAGLMRTKRATGLELLPAPKNLSDLVKKDYRIAVHAESMSHHFALGELKIPAERLIPCAEPEESIERILLQAIPRPAHILLTDAPHASKIQAKYAKATELLFQKSTAGIPRFEDAIAVRTDWGPVATLLNETLQFLRRSGAMERIKDNTLDTAFFTQVQ